MYVIMDKSGKYFEKYENHENIFTSDEDMAMQYYTEKGAWKDVMFYNMLRVDVVEVEMK